MTSLSDGWTLVPLKELVETSRPRVNPQEAGSLSFIGMDHVESRTMRLLGSVPASAMKSAAVHFQPGDVLYGRLRPYLNKVYRPSFAGLASAEFIALVPSRRVDGDYLRYLLSSAQFVRFAMGLTTGDRPRVDFRQIGEYAVPLPGLEEQRRIVAAIEQQITRLEAGTALTAGVRRRLGDLRRAVLSAATSRRLSRSNWQSLSLGDVADPSRPICYGILKPRTAAPGTIPYVEVRDLREPVLRPESLKRTTKELHEAFPRSVLRTGDVLVAVRGSYERIGIVPPDLEGANVSRDVARVSPGEGVEPRYLLLWLRSPVAQRYFRRVARGVAVKGVNIGDLRKTPIDLPPLAEQREIVQEVDRQLSLVDELESELKKSSARAEALRQSVLAAGFTGRLSSKEARVA